MENCNFSGVRVLTLFWSLYEQVDSQRALNIRVNFKKWWLNRLVWERVFLV